MGKVPAVSRGDALITEQAAIFIYLADLAPGTGLAPPIGDPLRGPYLRWLVYYAACFEPAITDRWLKHEPGDKKSVPYGDYDTMLSTLRAQLAKGPYILGERFTAADVLWGSALNWTTMFGLVEKTPDIAAYIDRIVNRPAAIRVQTKDAELATEHEA
jgi:glutathione S-transferase